MADQKLSARSITILTVGAYMHIIVPDGIGGYISYRIAFSEIITQSADYIRRAGKDIVVSAGEHTITYDSTFTIDCALNIIDKNGIGIGEVSRTADGFTYNSLGAGVIDYLAIRI
jgi:hypothetical protein